MRTRILNTPPSIAAAVVTLIAAIVIAGCAGLSRHQDLLVSQDAKVAGDGQVTVTYLGCNGFYIKQGDTGILVDPCFSRPSAGRVLLGLAIPPDDELIDAALGKIGSPNSVDAILVTHAHYDHLQDVPPVQQRLGGTVIASPTGCELASRAGVEKSRLAPVMPGATLRAGGATIDVLEGAHDTLCGILFYPGGVDPSESGKKPRTAADYVCGTPLAFLITIGGKTIYVDSGGTSEVLPPDRPGGTDLAILGVALKDGRKRFVPAVRRLRPRIIFPSHQDDFFRPIDKPYRFSVATDMDGVRESFEASGEPGRLVLLDFFDQLVLD